MPEVTIEKLFCFDCEHKWVPRTTPVYRCPRCQSFSWNVDKTKVAK